MDINIEGVEVTKLKQIYHEKGDIFHGLKCSESSFELFGESYFSFIKYNEVKAWKRHFEMICNLVVPVGEVRFVLIDLRNNSITKGERFSITLGPSNYMRLTIPPGIWYGFKGLYEGKSLLHNIASIEHDPIEQENVPLDKFGDLFI